MGHCLGVLGTLWDAREENFGIAEDFLKWFLWGERGNNGVMEGKMEG